MIDGSLRLSDVEFRMASTQDRERGLIGYVSLTVGNCLRLDGLALRRTSEGRTFLAFPSRVDRVGRERPYMRPLSEAVRLLFEDAVTSALAQGSPSAVRGAEAGELEPAPCVAVPSERPVRSKKSGGAS